MKWDAWKEHARIGSVVPKERPRRKGAPRREKRKDAVSIIRAQIALHDKLRAEVAAKRFRELEPIMFAGMAGKEA